MSSSKRPHDPLSALNHTALNANVDGLWRYQLRDENRALFLKVEALEKASRALPAKLDQRFNETTSSIEALIARVAAIEEENRQIKEDRQVCRDELASLKEQLRAMQQQDLGNPHSGVVWLHHEILQEEPGPSDSQHVQKAGPTTSVEFSQSKAPPAKAPTTSRNVVPRGTVKAPIPAKGNVSQAPTNDTASPSNPIPQATKKETLRPTNRKPSAAAVPKLKIHGTRGCGRKTPPKPTTASKTSPTAFRNLEQGPGGILAYYNAACKIHAETGGLDSQGEIEFVDAFIAGITSPGKRDDLSTQLEQWHPSRTKKDGNIQLMCRWEDVEEAMVVAGLMAEKANSEGPSNKKRKTLGDMLFD